jgi:soluble lytic murein transglycosylase-like protein
MMIKTTLWLGLAAVVAPLGAQAQVIEIDDSGDARTYDRPTVFAGSSAATIAPPAPKAARTQPALFAAAAKSHGLDLGLLEAVAWQESRGRMSAVSPKGALGVMQLMPGTAAEMGVRPDDLADNIRGGALYLRRQLDRFGGSVPLALAAYNAGPGAVLRYKGIPPYRETRDYVAKIMNRWRPTAATPTPTPAPTGILSIEVPQP